MIQKSEEMNVGSKCYKNLQTEIEKMRKAKSEVETCFERQKKKHVQVYSEQYTMLHELKKILNQLMVQAQQTLRCRYCTHLQNQVSILNTSIT